MSNAEFWGLLLLQQFNSRYTIETLSVVAEDRYETFRDRLTDKAVIGAISQARRKSVFFPTEKNVFEVAGRSLVPDSQQKAPTVLQYE